MIFLNEDKFWNHTLFAESEWWFYYCFHKKRRSKSPDFRGKHSVKFSGVFEADFQETTKSKDTLLPKKATDLTWRTRQIRKEIRLTWSQTLNYSNTENGTFQKGKKFKYVRLWYIQNFCSHQYRKFRTIVESPGNNPLNGSQMCSLFRCEDDAVKCKKENDNDLRVGNPNNRFPQHLSG